VEGYIIGATVFADSNENGVIDSGEVSTKTDEAGAFLLAGGIGPLKLNGGVDIATGLPFRAHLNAPAGSTVITPLTTLIVALAAQSIPDAHAKVLTAFGFDPTADLTTLDPIAGTSGGDAQAALAYTAGIEVYSTLTLIASLLAGNDPADYTSAYDAVLGALADLIATHGAGLDLTASGQLTELIDDAAAAGGVALDPAVRDGVVAIVAVLNQAVEDAGGATGVDLLSALSAIALVAQGAAADALKDVGDGATEVAAALGGLTGDALTIAIAEAKFNTGDVDGPAIQNAPDPAADAYAATFGQTLDIPATGVLGNDTDADGDARTASLVSGPAHGTLTLNPDGSFADTPDADIVADITDSFTYVANDGTADSAPATVTIDVTIGADTYDTLAGSAAPALYMLGAAAPTVSSAPTGRQIVPGIDNVIAGLGNDSIAGNNNGGILNGNAGNDVIRGGSGEDVVIGGPGFDRLTTGLGDDALVFRPGFGNDVVTDFNVGTSDHHDTLDLRGLGFANVEDVFAHTDGGPSAVIHAGADQVTLLNVTKAQLMSHDYDILV
jgi:Ca2+-binding RTX toxin-like protein